MDSSQCLQCGEPTTGHLTYVVVKTRYRRLARALSICYPCQQLLDAFLDGGTLRQKEEWMRKEVKIPAVLAG
jgi:hypothetical protein